MKKIIILLSICLGFAKAQAQTFNNYADTANYLIHQIGNKKSLYVGKPLSVLLDSLKIQPVDATAGSGYLKSDFGKSVTFDFNIERPFVKAHFIIVDFETVPAYDQLFPVFFPPTGGLGSLQSIINIYKTLIIKDVVIKDYTEDEPVNPGVHY
jgi:hypothetical protein